MNDHLTKKTREYLLLPPEERALLCYRDVWVPHPYGVALTECAKLLVSLPRVKANPGMAVIGASGVGKSRLAQRWSEESLSDTGGWAGKIMYIDLSNRKKGVDLEKRFLQDLGMIARGRAYTFSAKDYAEAQQAVRRLNIRAVIFDEAHGLNLRVTSQRLHNMFEALKGFPNQDWGLNVILCGIEDLREMLDIDDQIQSRYGHRTTELPEWKNDNLLASFIAAFMCYMPLQLPSEVSSTIFLDKLYSLASPANFEKKIQEGKKYRARSKNSSLRTMVDILREACRYAIVSGEEYIDVVSLQTAADRLMGKADAQALLIQSARVTLATKI
ncbi:TniB family NTP-binding protein [Pseudomonas viridiflava]|uniref:TniB family NTP-binding protein n=1 Tax=Pseudomonas viridiflava TaxID=33069 RepID=UPI000F057EBC|nr:TniB family NTP-binding protein [Pseudomonas viridiflava]